MRRAAWSVSMMKGIGKSFAAVSSLLTKPGATVTTRMPSGRRSTRSDSSRLRIAALVAPYACARVSPR